MFTFFSAILTASYLAMEIWHTACFDVASSCAKLLEDRGSTAIFVYLDSASYFCFNQSLQVRRNKPLL